jgi:thiamine pyrophosphate-dependent acetolactate synthase large subunit-like protein
MGVHAIRCRNVDELPAKMKEFLEYDGTRPVLMECETSIGEHVFPMVGGITNGDMFPILTPSTFTGTCW